MKGVIINHNTRYIGDLIQLFKGCDMINCANFNLEKVEEYDYVVLSGGPTTDENFDFIKDEMEWLLKTDKPIFGVCLGIQILCSAFGGEMKKFDKNRKLNENLKFVDTNYDMAYNHTYYFDKIPNEFIGEIKNNILLWMRHKTKPIIAFQGHPEITKDSDKLRDFFLTKIVEGK